MRTNDKGILTRLPIGPTGARRTRFGETPRYAAGLYDLGRGLYAWLAPNGSWGESNAGLIAGDGESLLVDTLWDLDCTRAMLEAMAPLTAAAPIRTVVNTHADGDHVWGNELLPGAEIVSTRAAYDEMLDLEPRSMVLLGRVGRLLSTLHVLGAGQVGHWLQNMVGPYDFQAVTRTLPTRTFEGELALQAGGREVQLIEVGPTHTRGDLLVYLPDARILFSGDIVFLGSTPVMWAGPLDNWLAALDRILEMDVDVVVPGHGPLTDKEGVRQVKAYWQWLGAQARQRFEAGMPAWQAARDMVLGDEFARQPFAGWDSPERIATSVQTFYRHLQGRGGHPGRLGVLNLLRKQALLARRLPHARPAVMHTRLPKSKKISKV